MSKRFLLATMLILLVGGVTVIGALLAPQLQTGALNAPTAKATIAGVVLRSTTGDPIPRATVTLIRVGAQDGPRGAQQPPQAGVPQRGQQQAQPAQQQGTTFTATTNDEGKFLLKDVDEGPYRLYAARNGFVRAEFGQRSPNRPGTVVNVRAGQQLTDMSFRLTPAGTISGRVMDSIGEPLPGVTVQALRSTYDATGGRTLQPAGTARTNDLGEYRIYWINPGRYFINANAARSGIEMITASATQAAAQALDAAQAQAAANAASIFGPAGNPNEVADTGFGPTYYPGSPDAARAVGVDLQPGAEMRAIDFTLVRTQRVRLSGRVIDASTGRPPQTAQLSVSSRDATSASPFDALFGMMDPSQGNRYNPATGEFVLPSVASGSYWLQVISQGARTAPQGRGVTPTTEEALAVFNSMNTARIPVDVQGSDIENLTLTVTPGFSVPGRIRIDGNQANSTDLQGIAISLHSTTGGPSILTMIQGGAVRPAQDGSFSVPRVTPGDYKLVLNGLGPNLYLKEARLGQSDAVNVVTISEPLNGSLDIVLRPNPGQVTGNVVDATMKPVTGVQAVLIPDRVRDRQDLYKTAVSDLEGRFTFRGITPGDYRIFAWEDIEPFSYFDPAVLSQYEAAGRAVRIQEGATENVEVKLIPTKTQ